MGTSSLAQSLREGRTVFASWHGLAQPNCVMAAAQAGLGCVVLDVQHGGFGYESVVEALPLAKLSGVSVGVRLAAHDYACAGRLVDAGVEAVIAPLIDTADDARRLVDAVKYLPVGMRSWGPSAAMYYAGIEDPQDQLRSANERVLAFAMIETSAGIKNIDDILAVAGIDGVFVGPSDLSIALSNGASLDAFGDASLPVIEEIARKACEADKFSAIFTMSGNEARLSKSYGYQLISLTTDKSALVDGFRRAIASASQA